MLGLPQVETTGRYGRTVGEVLVGGVDANLEEPVDPI
jgi:hypothetical protein